MRVLAFHFRDMFTAHKCAKDLADSLPALSPLWPTWCSLWTRTGMGTGVGVGVQQHFKHIIRTKMLLGQRDDGGLNLLAFFSWRCITRTINASLKALHVHGGAIGSGEGKIFKLSISVHPQPVPSIPLGKHPHEFSIKNAFTIHTFNIFAGVSGLCFWQLSLLSAGLEINNSWNMPQNVCFAFSHFTFGQTIPLDLGNRQARDNVTHGCNLIT